MPRISEFAGKPLFAKVASNPRRPDSHGHKSMAIILRKPGITYEDFLAKGGRNGDLRYDTVHGHVTTRKPRAVGK
jgi:hypothetical protein